jgi:hypothetical protein
MKIAFLGNCQLQQIGHFFAHSLSRQKHLHTVEWYLPIFQFHNKVDLVDLYIKLESCDYIFSQYYDDKWNEFSTAQLQKNFELTILPTLECPASNPQINYIDGVSRENKFDIWDVDYRLLSLYLDGIKVEQAGCMYHNISLSQVKCVDLTNAHLLKLKAKFLSGNIAVDYSEYLRKSILEQGFNTFFTHNHPRNHHLQFLVDKIIEVTEIDKNLLDLCTLPEILTDTIPPTLGSNSSSTYYRLKSRDIGLHLAAKIYYTFFDSIERKVLTEAYDKSILLQLI